VNGLRIVHEMPGRLRVRVPPEVDLPRLADAMRGEPGVVSVTWSPRTRSLLLVSEAATDLKDALGRHSGRAAQPDTPRVPTGVQAREPGEIVAAAVKHGVEELNAKVRHTTHGLMGLSGLLSTALVTWSVSQIVRGRANPLSWTSALWYSHGLFRDYGSTPGQE
jgi:hypothetical protein